MGLLEPRGCGKEQVGRALKATADYEEKLLEPIPEPEKRGLAGELAGERFRKEEKLQAKWKWMKRFWIQGNTVPLRRSEPRSRT